MNSWLFIYNIYFSFIVLDSSEDEDPISFKRTRKSAPAESKKGPPKILSPQKVKRGHFKRPNVYNKLGAVKYVDRDMPNGENNGKKINNFL
jgi:hypothetical protein